MRKLLILLLATIVTLSGCFGGDDKKDDDGDGDPGTGNGNGNGDGNVTTPPVDEMDNVTVSVQLSGAYPVSIAFSPSTITVPADTMVILTFTNNDQNPVPPHDFVVEGIEGANTQLLGNGESDTITFDSGAAGQYMYYCSVSGHRENGMEGTFVVEEA